MASDPKMLAKALMSQGRKIRSDLTPEQQARLQKYGSVGEAKAYRDPYRKYGQPVKYAGVGPKDRPA